MILSKRGVLEKGFALPTVLIASFIMLTVMVVSLSSTASVNVAIKDQYYNSLATSAAEAGLAYAKGCLDANAGVALWSDAKPLKPNTDCAGNVIITGNTTAEVLVVAGGGGGGGNCNTCGGAGGGGGGGVLHDSAYQLTEGTTSVTVGAGGSGGAGSNTASGNGSNGSNSVFGSMTAIGGGGGRPQSGAAGAVGGSGGGGSGGSSPAPGAGGAGTVGQGNSGAAGTDGNTGPYRGGGGGGAGASANGLNGGAGLAFSISGTSRYYGGGGGGGNYSTATAGTGGSSVGGNGANQSVNNGNGYAGTASRGGGGGGANGSNKGGSGGAGGSGVVIISYPDDGTISATGGTVTTSGGKKIHTFTSSGNFEVSFNAPSCDSGDHCYLVNRDTVRSAFSVGAPTTSGDSVIIRSSGTASLLRTSNGAVWRTYQQVRSAASRSYSSTPVYKFDQIFTGSSANHTCGISAGKAYCWGANNFGQLGNNSTTPSSVPVPVYAGGAMSGLTVTSIAVAQQHTCAIADGKAFCWGMNGAGQLGNNSTTQSLVPVAVNTSGVLSGRTVTSIAVGGSNTSCAVANGAPFCWGANGNGQFGNASTSSSLVPVAMSTSGVLSGRSVTQIVLGNAFSCVVANGAAFCSGYNGGGQLGNNSTTQSTSPVAVTTSGVLSGRSVTAITAGETHACVVADGAAFCWGVNSSGRLGNSSTTQSLVPVAVTASGVLAGQTVTSISAGNGHTCAVANGSAYCWGINTGGRLGNSSSTTSTSPVAVNVAGVLSGRAVTQITAGLLQSCAIANGDAFCWGTNTNGVLGNNSTTASNVPVTVDTSNLVANYILMSGISAGANHSCGISYGLAYCWGSNTNGQLGNNSTTQSLVPVPVDTSGVLAGRAVTKIVAGSTSTCAIANGAAFCWGGNTSGQLGNNSTTQSLVPVAVDTSGVLAGRTVTDISVNHNGNACVAANGAAFCWGYGNDGRLGNDTTSSSSIPVAVTTTLMSGAVTDVTSAQYHSCAIANAKAYCWGFNSSGQLGNNSTTQSNVPVAVNATPPVGSVLSGRAITGISALGVSTCAVGNGAAACWGSGSAGRLGNNSTSSSSVAVLVNTSGVLSGRTVTQISSGTGHSCVTADGAAFCWGTGTNGRLGNNATAQSLVPVAVTTSGVVALSGRTVEYVSGGNTHSCAIANGIGSCWGGNATGQLGNNSTTPISTAVSITTTNIKPPQFVISDFYVAF